MSRDRGHGREWAAGRIWLAERGMGRRRSATTTSTPAAVPLPLSSCSITIATHPFPDARILAEGKTHLSELQFAWLSEGLLRKQVREGAVASHSRKSQLSEAPHDGLGLGRGKQFAHHIPQKFALPRLSRMPCIMCGSPLPLSGALSWRGRFAAVEVAADPRRSQGNVQWLVASVPFSNAQGKGDRFVKRR